MSRGADGAGDSALIQDLAVLRSALDLYQTENGGLYPTAANVVAALTTYSDGAGGLAAAKDATHIYGPYMRSIPALPVGTTRKGSTGIAGADAAGIGWLYTAATGAIAANTTAAEVDAKGVAY